MVAAEQEFHVAGQVKATVESVLKMRPDQLSLASTFESFGIDSIVAMQLISRLRAKFGVSIAPAQFLQLRTVQELASYIDSELQGVRPDRPVNSKAANVVPLDRSSTVVPRSVSPLRQRVRQKRAPATPSSPQIREFISRQYGIELDGRRLNTIDEAVEELISNHRAKLVRHFWISDTPDPTTFAALAASSFDSSNQASESSAPAAAAAANDIAIVGLSCRFPDAPNAKVFWDNLLAGKSSIREISSSRWAAGGETPIPLWGALVDDVDCFDPSFFGISADAAALMDPQERLLYQEVYRALQDAGSSVSKLAASNTGIFVGYEYAEYEHLLRRQAGSIPGAPTYSSASPAYYLANRLSYAFDFRGPSEAINLNCASSAVALKRAFNSLASGESDLAVVAGVCLNLFVDDYLAAAKYGLLSADGTCGVFDDAANGYTRGEGVGAIILKRLDAARRDNDRIYAVVKGCHENNRGRANSLSEVKHEAITDVLSGCYARAGIDFADVSYIEVDGYATKWGDSFEFEGIRNAFAAAVPRQARCALGSVKGNIGHLEPASGIASLIKVALAMFHKRFPPTISKRTLSEFIDTGATAASLYIADRPIAFDDIRKSAATPIRAGVNSFSDSGANLHILLEEHIAQLPRTATAEAAAPELCVLSARDRTRLDESVSQLIDALSSGDTTIDLQDAAYTLQVGRDAMSHRLAIVGISTGDVLEKLQRYKRSRAPDAADLESAGIYYHALEENRASSIAHLITQEMIDMQVDQALRTGQWGPVALLWINGVSIPWSKLWSGRQGRTISLPGYPFARERYWIDAARPAQTVLEVTQPAEPVQRQTIRELPEAPPDDDATKIAAFLKQELALQLKRSHDQIETERNFLELGMTSLGVVSLCRSINRRLDAKLSPTAFFKYPDVVTLSAYLAQAYPGKIDVASATMPQVEQPELVPASGAVAELASRRVKSGPSSEQILASVLWREDCDDGNYLRMSF